MESTKCAICNNDSFTLVLNKLDVCELYKSDPAKTLIKYNGEFVNYAHVMCNECGLVQINPRMSEEESIEYYKNEYRETYVANRDQEDSNGFPFTNSHLGIEIYNAVVRYDLLSDHGFLKPGINTLDIGSSIGALPAYMHATGMNAFGIELSPFGVYTKSLFNFDGIFNTPIEDYTTNLRFDVITLCDVFEHVADPQKVLSKVRQLMADDGVLLIEVPDIFKPHGGVYGFLSNAHLFTYSKKSITNMLNLCGFEIIHFEYGGYCDNMRLLVKKGEVKQIDSRDTFEEVAFHLKNYNAAHTAVLGVLQNTLQVAEAEAIIQQNLPNYNYLDKIVGTRLILERKHEEAKGYLERCLQRDFNTETLGILKGNLYGMLAVCAFNSEDAVNAKRYLDKAIELLPRYMDFPYLEELEERKIFDCRAFIDQCGLTYYLLEEIDEKLRIHAKAANF